MILATAILTLLACLVALIWRPSIGWIGLIAGGTWNIIDFWPDRAITDPYTIGTVAFNVADLLIVAGSLVIIARFVIQTRPNGLT